MSFLMVDLVGLKIPNIKESCEIHGNKCIYNHTKTCFDCCIYSGNVEKNNLFEGE